MEEPTKVFLCHASEDKDSVKKVYDKLKTHGVRPWLDKEDLLPGQNWDLEIRKTIKRSEFVLLFFSKISVSKRSYVQKEFKLALDVYDEIPDGDVFLLPIRLDECDVPERFKELHYCDLFEPEGFEKILKAIHKPLKLDSPGVWSLKFAKSFAGTLQDFQNAGPGLHKARDILSTTPYTVWNKLKHWGLIDAPKKGHGRITERGTKFLEGYLKIPEKLYIKDNKVIDQSHQRIRVNDL